MSIKAAAAAFMLAITAPLLAGSAAAQDGAATAAEAAETVLHEGAWTNQNYKTQGTWKIVDRDGAAFVVLSDDFKTKRAPDLKIFLNTRAAADVTNGNATTGSAFIAELSSARGGQSYPIPADVDLADFTSIIIHCERFSKLWTAADIRA